MLLYAITGAGENECSVFREVKGFATQSTDAGDTATLAAVKGYVSHGSWQQKDSPGIVGDVDSYAAMGNANLGEDKAGAVGDVDGYASMGFLQGGVELDSVAKAGKGYPHILISFAYDKDASFFERKLGYDPPDWLGDSGAFTAWTVGDQIDIDELIEWCRVHVERKPTFQCISLDVIPGTPGGNRKPTKAERTKAIKESLANGDAMREAGLKIMEVFHVFEPLDHLELLLDRRQEGEVLGLGGMVGRGEALKRDFADEVFSFIRKRTGSWQGIPPLHGLGISIRSPIAARYPWWSVDSSSWIAPAQYGKKVTRYGTLKGDDPRTSHRDVRHLYLVRALEGWLKQEAALTKMWADRGVTYAS